MTSILELKNVSKVYPVGKKEVHALNPISFDLLGSPAKIITVAGESGSGKTTLASIMLGLLNPTTGSVLYEGKDVQQLSGAHYKEFRKNVQAVFQDPFAVFNPFYHVDHLLEVPIQKFNGKLSRSARQQLMEEALQAVGLQPSEILGRYPHQLSGGQRQRINVARAIVIKPKILVADEPVSMVDASLRANILEALVGLRENFKVNILYITHDLTTAYHVSDSIIVLYRGSVMEAGDIAQVVEGPQHPYTRLLINSIPWPDLSRKWDNQQYENPDIQEIEGPGCKFYSRCPNRQAQCRETPDLVPLRSQHLASCWLHPSQSSLNPSLTENL
jgi:oligopeptide/dipeptide ABC transporter ATP-binding protein